MKTYEPATYGDRIAGIYDELYPEIDQEAVPLLKELAREGPALELGIGTGRAALPLAASGIEVAGIDASDAMLEKLKAKPGGERIQLSVGDFASFSMDRQFSLIYVLFNTFFALLEQEDQVSCMKSAASHLQPGGVFLIEVFVPDLSRYVRRQAITALNVETDSVKLDVARWDPAGQRITVQHVVMSEAGVKLYPVQLRYVYPSELDLMARLAGLSLRSRWGDWDRSEFSSDSTKHVSVYEKAEALKP
jgi:SAM-dependent methyltransferase